jgi:hypothetical protein
MSEMHDRGVRRPESGSELKDASRDPDHLSMIFATDLERRTRFKGGGSRNPRGSPAGDVVFSHPCFVTMRSPSSRSTEKFPVQENNLPYILRLPKIVRW